MMRSSPLEVLHPAEAHRRALEDLHEATHYYDSCPVGEQAFATLLLQTARLNERDARQRWVSWLNATAGC